MEDGVSMLKSKGILRMHKDYVSKPLLCIDKQPHYYLRRKKKLHSKEVFAKEDWQPAYPILVIILGECVSMKKHWRSLIMLLIYKSKVMLILVFLRPLTVTNRRFL